MVVLSASIVFGLFVSSAIGAVKKKKIPPRNECDACCVSGAVLREAVKASLLAKHKILVFALACCWCEKAVCLGKCVSCLLEAV